MLFENRAEAGRRLAGLLREYVGPQTVVLGLARGGVVVAAEVAAELGACLDVLIARKIGAPGCPEYALGAIVEGGFAVANEAEIYSLELPEQYVHEVAAVEKQRIVELQQIYRGGRPRLDVDGRTVVLVDDGVATGCTVKAALASLRARGAAILVVGVPVGPRETLASLRTLADVVVCLASPEQFYAVGAFYEDFDQVTDDEVKACLAAADCREAPCRPLL